MGVPNSVPIPLRAQKIVNPLDPSFVYEEDMGFQISTAFWTKPTNIVLDRASQPFIRFDKIKNKVYVYDIRDGVDKHICTLRKKTASMHTKIYIIMAYGTAAPDASFHRRFWNFTDTYEFYLNRRGNQEYTISGIFKGMRYVFSNANKDVAQSGFGLWDADKKDCQLLCAPRTDTLLCLIGLTCIEWSAYSAL
jgi:hypothetical protein